MTDGRGVLREIAWREVFPWLLLFRSFRLAIHPGILTVALLAALITPLGWNILYRAIFWKWESVPSQAQALVVLNEAIPSVEPGDDEEPKVYELRQAAHLQKVTSRRQLDVLAVQLMRLPGVGRVHDADILGRLGRPEGALSAQSPIGYVFYRFADPVLRMYQTSTDLSSFSFCLLGTLWTLAVWGFGGGMITRMAAIELGREEQAGFRRSFRLTLRRWFDYFTAPLYPLLGTFLIALISIPVGWIILSHAGTIVGGLLWIFVLLGGALSALLLLWLFIGWPLMWPAISCEETGDSFEAMSRSFAYAFQRPLHYLFYAAVAALLGFISWSLIDFLCMLALAATHWAVSWGAGHEWTSVVLNYPTPTSSEDISALGVGATMIRSVEGILLALSESFAYSFFWVSATAIYLLLRQNVDRAELDEVWIEDDASRFGLPRQEPEPVSTETPETPASPAAPSPNEAAIQKTDALENNQAE